MARFALRSTLVAIALGFIASPALAQNSERFEIALSGNDLQTQAGAQLAYIDIVAQARRFCDRNEPANLYARRLERLCMTSVIDRVVEIVSERHGGAQLAVLHNDGRFRRAALRRA